MLEQYIRKERARELSIDELKSMVTRPGLKFVDWVNFKGSGIKQLMGNSQGVILLLEHHGKDNGHFVLFLKHRNHIEYFDSYGLAPLRLVGILGFDQNETNRFMQIVSGCKKHHVQFQTKRADINTCGRYAVMRYNCKFASFKEFRGIMHHASLHPDDVVTMLTMSSDFGHLKKVFAM